MAILYQNLAMSQKRYKPKTQALAPVGNLGNFHKGPADERICLKLKNSMIASLLIIYPNYEF